MFADKFKVENHLKSLHEGLCPGLGDGTKIINEICFGHPNTGVDKGKSAFMNIGDDFDLQFLSIV